MTSAAPTASRACEAPDCDRIVELKGLCRKHYERQRARHRHRDDQLVRTRARHRATARLVERHRAEFAVLMAEELDNAEREAQALSGHTVLPSASLSETPTSPVRFKPGPQPTDQRRADRVRMDVARCRHCRTLHDSEHSCPECGADLTKRGTAIDDIAVERAISGEPVKLTRAERVEAVRRMSSRFTPTEICRRLHMSGGRVRQILNQQEKAS